MDDLIFFDIDNFLNKYTRFMTKDIYISKKMYDDFLNKYSYIYDYLDVNFLSSFDSSKYKRLLKINNNRYELLKLHNKKYLKKAINDEAEFFNNLKLDIIFDNNEKGIVLSNEDKMLVVGSKNVDSLILGKVKYLKDVVGVIGNKILVFCDEVSNLEELFIRNNIKDVELIDVAKYKDMILEDKKLVTEKEKYNILVDYIINILFKDKVRFKEFYNEFSNNIYLNKDYKDYDTFFDYHNYMYKRKYLSSKLSLERFINSELEKRKKYLRTIDNVVVNRVEEVDIGNYLCVNGVDYKYIKEEGLFFVGEGYNKLKIKVIDKNENRLDFVCEDGILYIGVNSIKNGSYLDKLEDIFVFKKIDIIKCDEKKIYDILKESMIDNYFSEFINKYLVKYLDYYEMYKNFDKVFLNDKKVDLIVDIYCYYNDYLEKNGYVTKNKLYNMVSLKINSLGYKYIIVNSDLSLELNGNYMKFIDEYKDVNLIRENIKLLYDYKKYLNNNKLFVLNDVYMDEEEIYNLTSNFLKCNLDVINDVFINSDKRLSIYFYDDSNRLLINKNISRMCYEIVRSNDDLLVGVNSIKDVNLLIYKEYFIKKDKKNLVVDGNKVINCEEVLKLKKCYKRIILPFLIMDSYHEENMIRDRGYLVKLMIYLAFCKCLDELILFCPLGKKDEMLGMFKNFKNISVFE